MWVAVASTVVFFALVALLIVNSPGWSSPNGIKQAFFNGALFAESLPKILDGFWLNVQVFVIAEVLVLAFAAPRSRSGTRSASSRWPPPSCCRKSRR